MIFAIESSCDESAVALWDPHNGMCGEWIHTQIEQHQVYGGIVPDLASREHLKNFPWLISEACKNLDPSNIEKIAVTCGPGLAGCLALGVSTAKALGLAWKKPVVGVNHLRGHAWSPFIATHAQSPENFGENLNALLPHLGLIVSGGNTILFQVDKNKQLSILAQTIDDAAGEALDKGAKLLGMVYPGGPLIEKHALGGDAAAYDFPRSFASNREPRFSFSGLKTSLRYAIEKMDDRELKTKFSDICASYQQAVVDALCGKTRQFFKTQRWNSLGLSGGVANNKTLQAAFQKIGASRDCPVLIAQPKHTGDNAGMIAFAAAVDPEHCTDLSSGNEEGATIAPSAPLVG